MVNKSQLQLQFAEFPGSSVQPDIWRPIHYLGSKLRIVESLRLAIDRADPSMGTVCDLFAGSGTVSAALARYREVIAVDIQEYSRVLCSAVLNPPNLSAAQIGEVVKSFNSRRQEIAELAAPMVEYEQYCFQRARTGDVLPLCELIENAPISKSNLTSLSSPLRQAGQRTFERFTRAGLELAPETLIFRNFGGLYFSYLQSTELDALLAVAHRNEGTARDCVLAAAISTASDIVNTVGKHFAQPIKPRGGDGGPKQHAIRKILKDRTINAYRISMAWLHKYIDIVSTNRRHRVICCDFEAALQELKSLVDVVYADPPYTREHYSRFYHVLETMSRWDQPSLSTTRIRSDTERTSRAMYRSDRHQSQFCIITQAPNAFRRLFAAVKDLNVPLVLSYSPHVSNKVMTISEISSLAKRFFDRVDQISAGRISHSKLNNIRFNTSVQYDAELISFARKPARRHLPAPPSSPAAVKPHNRRQ